MEKLNAEQAEEVISLLHTFNSYSGHMRVWRQGDYRDLTNSNEDALVEMLQMAYSAITESSKLGLNPEYIDNLMPGVIENYKIWNFLRKRFNDKTNDSKKVVEFLRDDSEVF